MYKCAKDPGFFIFHCPGCKIGHGVWTGEPNPHTGSKWTWNGNMEKPTFSPSLLITSHPRCHSYVTDGKIQFLSDCDHELAGQTIELKPW